MSGDRTLLQGRDTWVDPEFPAMPHFGRVNLQVGGSYGPNHQPAYAYIYFQNPAPPGANIVSATLRIWGLNNWNPHTAQTIMHVQRINASVKFPQLSWNNRPGVVGGIRTVRWDDTDHVGPWNPNGPTWWDFNITTQLQTITNGAGNFGFRISTDDTVRRHFWSFDATHHRPTLHVVWSDAPQAPTRLNPSGGQVVAVTAPVLTWDYTDVLGNTDLAAIQVQISPSANWSAPSYDSHVQPATDNEWDLAADASYVPPTADGFTRFWRVRVQDGAGMWSRWSAQANGVGAKYTYHNKGVVEILSPGPAPNNYVEDLSPPILWQVTGRSQRQWRVTVTNPNTHEQLFTTGIRKGADDAFTIPYDPDHPVFHRWDRTYRVFVDIWDFQDRAQTPGVPIYARAQRDFFLRQDPTTDPPINLTATFDEDGKPYLHLHWQTAGSAPDFFNILRGPSPDRLYVIRQRIPSANLIGDNPLHFNFTDRDATQNVPHTWSVQSIINNRASANNPTWTGRIENVHAWLIDWETDHLVAILDPDVSFEMPDTSATYEPIMRDRVVRVTGRRRGVEGTMSGRITGFGGTTTYQWRQQFLWFKDRPSRIFRLMVGNWSWRVLLGDMTVTPMRIPDDVAEDVSFSFWSVEGPPEADEDAD